MKDTIHHLERARVPPEKLITFRLGQEGADKIGHGIAQRDRVPVFLTIQNGTFQNPRCLRYQRVLACSSIATNTLVRLSQSSLGISARIAVDMLCLALKLKLILFRLVHCAGWSLEMCRAFATAHQRLPSPTHETDLQGF